MKSSRLTTVLTYVYDIPIYKRLARLDLRDTVVLHLRLGGICTTRLCKLFARLSCVTLLSTWDSYGTTLQNVCKAWPVLTRLLRTNICKVWSVWRFCLRGIRTVRLCKTFARIDLCWHDSCALLSRWISTIRLGQNMSYRGKGNTGSR